MSDQIHESSKRKRPGMWIASVVLSLPILYVLSPPVVMMIFGEQAIFNVDWMFRPLQHLERSSHLFMVCYRSYFDLFPGDCWFVWSLSSDFYAQYGGFGEIGPLP